MRKTTISYKIIKLKKIFSLQKKNDPKKNGKVISGDAIMSNDNDTKLEVLSNHYSETFMLLKEAVAKRDRLFLYMLTVIFIILLYMNTPTVVSSWINSFLGSQVGLDANNNPINVIDVSFIGAVFWFGLLSISHTYFQTVLHVERQWNYVYKLEGQLSAYFDDKAFIREGKHYRDQKRKFSSWTKFIFWNLSPTLLFVFVVFWLVFLFKESGAPIGYLAIDSLTSVSLLISMGLYLLALYKKK
ncbi:MAG: hypothetical protein C4583_03245 [Anaerolineaceae bacterium]|nr:MAG: hypothetical protein C4583_03245 [Anaerolineaceae bacterium]